MTNRIFSVTIFLEIKENCLYREGESVMKKTIKVLGLVAIMTLSMSIQVFAGEWKKDNTGWWYQNNDNSYPVNTWAWIDGNKDGIAECYYFNENGYMLANTNTPDNYTVNENGAWTVNGVVQTKNMFISSEDVDRDVKSNNQNENKEDKKASEKNVNSYPEHSKQLEEWLKDMPPYPDKMRDTASTEEWNWN